MLKINKVFLSGKIGKDLEKRFTDKGKAFVTFSIAVDKSYKKADGNWENQVAWVDCVAWEKQADKMVDDNYMHKGSPVLVEGRIDSRQYEKDGQKRTAFEIVVEYVQLTESGKVVAGEPLPESRHNADTAGTSDDVPF
jgi:single-strand DNA-binding protein